MTALPSAFFIHVSQAWCSVWPRYWIAKSTIVVVPPNAAARVPVSKSSAEVAPPNGMSRWVWTSMPPGSTYLPRRVDHLVDVGGRDVERHADDGDLLVLDQHVARVLIDRRDDRAVLDQCAHRSLSRSGVTKTELD